MISRRTLAAILSVFLFTSCVTTSRVAIDKSTVNKQTPNIVRWNSVAVNASETKRKIAAFRKILNSGKKLSPHDWKLHDDLFDTYVSFKRQIDGAIVVPGNSKLKLDLQSFCLNSNMAQPSSREIFRWVKGDPKIPYFKEIMSIASREDEVSQQDVQTLLWNLGNGTYWENYPEPLKNILLRIDPQASLKLPSEIKSEIKDKIKGAIFDAVPGLSEAQDALQLIKGKYYEFQDIKSSIEKIVSKKPLEDPTHFEGIPETELFSETQSEGFTKQHITLLNPTSKPQTLKLSDYYLQPKRSDVQRVAVASPSLSKAQVDLLKDLESVLYGDMLRLGIGFTPGLNDVADLYELFFGKDYVSGKALTSPERLLSGVGLIAGSGAGYRYAIRALNSPAKFIPEFEKGILKISGREIAMGNLDDKEIISIFDEARKISTEVAGSPVLIKRHNALEPGPLSKIKLRNGPYVSETFRSGTYLDYKTSKAEVFYRVQSGPVDEKHMGRFWTRAKPSGPTQAAIDSALSPVTNNKGTHWVEIEVPRGVNLFEGVVGPDGGLIGGGNQIFIELVNPKWVREQGAF